LILTANLLERQNEEFEAEGFKQSSLYKVHLKVLLLT